MEVALDSPTLLQQYKELHNINKNLMSIYKSKIHWNIQNIVLLKIKEQIELEVIEFNKEILEKLIQPVGGAIEAGRIDAPGIAHFNHMCVKITKFQNKADDLTSKLKSFKKLINENGAFWRQATPEDDDLQKLTRKERINLVKKWKNGGKFISHWIRIFKSLKKDWERLRKKLDTDLYDCVRLVFLEHKENLFVAT